MLATVLGDFWRFLTFRPLKGDVQMHYGVYLLVALAIVWIVGFGRSWDFAAAPWWMRTGLTSIVYTFALAGFIWMIVAALKPERWSYRNVVLMVAMTAAPGIIYAIPVERTLPAELARAVNLTFLLIVAAWRMALYRHFLRSVAKLPPYETLVAWLLPPTIIVAGLSVFGVLDAIMRSMGGVRDQADPGEISGGAIMLIALVSWIALPVLLLTFAGMAITRNRPPSGTPPP